MKNIDFATECAIQLIIQNLDGSRSQIKYERSNLLSLSEIITDAMDVFDELTQHNERWHFLMSVYVARTPEEYDDFLTDEDIIQ